MSYRECTVNDCSSKHFGKGYCLKHYGRLRRNGTLETTRKPPNISDDEVKDYISANIKLEEDTGCWVWQKSLTEQGYGDLSYKGKRTVAHRVTYKLYIDPDLSDNVYLDHENCISRACVNPFHVRPVTKAQNNSHRVSLQPSNVSGFRNVSYRPNRNKPYRVVIQKEGRQHYFGSYFTAEEANEVAIEKRKELFGDYAGTI